MKFILGTKKGMTQVYDESGNAHAATILHAAPLTITQTRSAEKDGYAAVQVAQGAQKKHRVNKAALGHLKEAYKTVREFRPRQERKETVDGLETGQSVDVSVFEVGDTIVVSSISKGKGFQGVVKRHGFSGGPKTHGQKHSEREPGSIGSTGPSRVFKGVKMAGRMGGNRVTVKNLKVLQVNKEESLLLVSGAVPGRRGTLVEVRSA